MRIAFFELEGWEEPLIRAAFPRDELFLTSERLDADHLPARTDFEAISVFIASHITKDVAAKFPNVKLVATRSTGYDHMDVQGLKELGIVTVFVPGYGDNTVAEFTFGLILNLTRHIYTAIDRLKKTGPFSLEGLRGVDLKGRVLGVVGTGRIGRQVIRIAQGFGMTIVAYDPRPDEALAAAGQFAYISLEELLKTADIVTLHCPLTEATRYLVNAGNIGLMKKTAYLVNTSRGPLIETEALVQALQSGALAGAALDVVEGEGEMKNEVQSLMSGHLEAGKLKTMLEDHILMRMPNVLVTPHLAFDTEEALRRIIEITIENIQAVGTKNVVPG